MNCRACNAEITDQDQDRGYAVNGRKIVGIVTCSHCGGVQGECYLGESYTIVRNAFADDEVPFEQTRYYDFTVIGSNGIARRHGWFDTVSRRITQVG